MDPTTGKVVEANPAAALLLAPIPAPGRPRIPGRLRRGRHRAIQSLIAGVRAAGRANDVRARLRSGHRVPGLSGARCARRTRR
jgi:hypothetical protein